ncbi:extracellular solute-binding protein [Streptococcus ictaluri]|uniref:ABC transporter, solute-binding protein n=1 Tax=Streptococcus ictaluri 707-05 TaxID=764299 RepID=G5JZU5_9STRE|nr:extracellular solute-binding protein [Streptococcus ictaluri]EHI70818.1 ABC transporter, solute-binding protein [Streptococcus ictaluri 707-05]
MKKPIRSYLLLSSLLPILALSLSACQSQTASKESKSTSDKDFTVATVRWQDWGKDFLKGFVEKAEKKADVSVNWKVYLNSDWADQKAVLMAGGKLPDAFLGSISFSDSDLSVFKNRFIPLESLIDKHMPNLTKIMKKNPNMRAIVTDPDGHIYSLPKREPMSPKVANQLYINQKWLDRLGLQMPKTYEDLVAVSKAFRDKDANGNGNPSDEIPFENGGVDPILTYALPFGTVISPGESGRYWTVNDKKITFTPTADYYKEGIKWVHQQYQEKLIDLEIFTQDSSQAEAKRQNKGDAIVGISAGWTADSLFGPHASEYVPMPPITGPSGKAFVHSDGSGYGRNELLITDQAKDPGKILAFFDQFYTEDATIQTFYGSFDKATKKNEDGTYTVLEAPDGEQDIFAWVNSLRSFGPKYAPDGFNQKVTLPKGAGDGLKLEAQKVVEDAAQEAFPNVMFTQEELNRLSVISVDIMSFIQSKQAHWVTEGNIDKEWDDYLKALDKMGLKEYQSIHQTAYKRYLQSEKK